MPIEEVFRAVSEQTGEPVGDPVRTAIRESRTVELANHTTLIARSGAEVPIADTAAPILTDSGEIQGAVLVFRDQTREREYKRRLQDREERLRRLFEHMSSGFALHEVVTDERGTPVDYRFVELNPAFSSLTGIGPDIVGKTAREALPGIEADPADWIERCGAVALTGESTTFEAYSEPVGKWFLVVAYSPEPNTFATIFTDISRRRIAEQRVVQQQNLLHSMEQVARVGGWAYDAESGTITWTPGTYEIYEVSPEEFNPNSIQHDLSFYSPDDAKRLEQAFAAVMESGEPYDLLLRFTGAGGTEKWVQTIGLPHEVAGEVVGAYGNIQDVTERTDVSMRYAGLFYSIGDAILIADSDRKIVDCNPAFSELFGYTPDEVSGESTAAIYWSNAEHDRIGNELSADRATETFKAVARFRRNDGTDFPGELRVSPLVDPEQRPLGFIEIIHDRTDEELLERELIAAHKMEALGQIAGGIAHDFNNVLTAISGAAQVLEVSAPDEPLKQYAGMIRSAVKRGMSVTMRLLTFTRASELQAQSIGLGSFLAEFKDTARHSLQQNIGVHVQNGSDVQRVLIDPAQFQQVLFTLTVNAAEAMPDGGDIYLSVRRPTEDEVSSHQVASAGPDTYWCLEVTDTGTGMDEQTRRRVFEPFFTTKGPARGTGLGLSVVRKIVHLHKGWIDVESIPGQGTTFTLGLPVGDAVETESSTDDKPVTGSDEALLIVDDEEPIRLMLEHILTGRGYRVKTAETAGDALRVLHDEPGTVDLILTDIGLPDMNGKSLIVKIQAVYPEIPIIAMTGYVDAGLGDSLYAVGANSIMTKPFDVNQLVGEVRTLLDSAEENAEREQ